MIERLFLHSRGAGLVVFSVYAHDDSTVTHEAVHPLGWVPFEAHIYSASFGGGTLWLRSRRPPPRPSRESGQSCPAPRAFLAWAIAIATASTSGRWVLQPHWLGWKAPQCHVRDLVQLSVLHNRYPRDPGPIPENAIPPARSSLGASGSAGAQRLEGGYCHGTSAESLGVTRPRDLKRG